MLQSPVVFCQGYDGFRCMQHEDHLHVTTFCFLPIPRKIHNGRLLIVVAVMVCMVQVRSIVLQAYQH